MTSVSMFRLILIGVLVSLSLLVSSTHQHDDIRLLRREAERGREGERDGEVADGETKDSRVKELLSSVVTRVRRSFVPSNAMAASLYKRLQQERRSSPWQRHLFPSAGRPLDKPENNPDMETSEQPDDNEMTSSADFSSSSESVSKPRLSSAWGEGGEMEEGEGIGGGRVKKFKLSFYDCISLYCSGVQGSDRNNCILKFCHRN